MDTFLSLRFLVIVTISAFISTVGFADANLTPDQLVLLMKASREQYGTIDSKMKVTAYQFDVDNKTNPKHKMDRVIVSRCTRKKSFSRIVETSYPDIIPDKGGIQTTISTCALTPEGCKQLIEASDNRTPRGYVKLGGSLEKDQGFYQSFFTIHAAMWDFFGWPWEKMDLNEATISRDEKNNCYVMKVKMGSSQKGPFVTLYVDPSKDFIPVKKEFLKYDGTLLASFECSDFHQAEDRLWIPYRYSWIDPRVHYGEIYEVEKAIVNQPIPDNALDFAFPNGTIVDDERLNVKYKVDDTNQVQDTIVDPCSLVKTDVSVTAPASEQDLISSASKAKELLRAYTERTASPAVEVLPTVVLVTLEQSEYKLSVTKSDGTKPVLLNYKFESDALKLSSLKNLIQTQDQLVANVSRLKSCAGFAIGTLLLEYEGEKDPVKVTFVSAPLPDAS